MFVKQVLLLFAIFVGINTGLPVKNCPQTNKQSIPPIPKENIVFEENYDQQAIAKRLEVWKPGDKQNAWELSGLFEGDIMRFSNPVPIYGLRDKKSRWTNGIVPYYIQPNDFTLEQRSIILGALEEIQNRTCIRFRPYKQGDRNYVIVQGSAPGCWSSAGKQYHQGQLLNLQASACVEHGIAIHEFMHALGFLHEQSAPDRDNWIRILWHNIQRGNEGAFQKFDSSMITNFGFGYDYDSIMHYGPYAFSKNGAPTIQPKMPNARIGQRSHLSEKDIKRVHKMYELECVVRKRKESQSNYSNDNDLYKFTFVK